MFCIVVKILLELIAKWKYLAECKWHKQCKEYQTAQVNICVCFIVIENMLFLCCCFVLLLLIVVFFSQNKQDHLIKVTLKAMKMQVSSSLYLLVACK